MHRCIRIFPRNFRRIKKQKYRRSMLAGFNVCRFIFCQVPWILVKVLFCKYHFYSKICSSMSRVMTKPVYAIYANNKGADQPAHPRSLISAFVFRCVDSIPSSCYIRNFKILASLCLWAGRVESYLVTNPEDRFSRDEAHMGLPAKLITSRR